MKPNGITRATGGMSGMFQAFINKEVNLQIDMTFCVGGWGCSVKPAGKCDHWSDVQQCRSVLPLWPRA